MALLLLILHKGVWVCVGGLSLCVLMRSWLVCMHARSVLGTHCVFYVRRFVLSRNVERVSLDCLQFACGGNAVGG